MAWFEKLKESLGARGFVQSQVDPFICYKEEMVLLFYVDYYIFFSTFKDKMYELYITPVGIFQYVR